MSTTQADGAVNASSSGNVSSAARRSLVVAAYDEDLSWLKTLPGNFDVSLYQSKDPSGSLGRFVENVGNEATKYLTHIVENYDSLPQSVVFVQAGLQDWHDPLPKNETLRSWNWDWASERGGIAFLPTAAPCLIEDSVAVAKERRTNTLTGTSDQDAGVHVNQDQVPDEARCLDVKEHSPAQMATLKEVWPEVFERQLGPIPERWLTRCCAQFEVTKEAIHQHPQSFYSMLLNWVMEHDRELLKSDYAEEMRRNHDPGRRDAGHVMEVTWALLFSEPMSRVVLPDPDM